MAFKIFERVGLFKSFDIPVDSFIHFFTELERGYIDLPCKYSLFSVVKLLNKIIN